MRVLILHLSDLHLTANGNTAEFKFVSIGKAVQNEEVDLSGVFVVVSGDVAYSGKQTEYAIASRLLLQLPLRA